MRNRCSDYIANDRIAEEFIIQISILSDGVTAETDEGGVLFRLTKTSVTIFECDCCTLRANCPIRSALEDAA